MSSLMHIKKGDTLYNPDERSDRRHTPRPCTLVVTKVGREYLYAKNPESEYDSFKICRDDGWISVTYGSGHRVYESYDAYVAAMYRRRLVKSIDRMFITNGIVIDGSVPTEDIEKAMKLLKIEVV